jgi:26S proteasome regulatory subunit N10
MDRSPEVLVTSTKDLGQMLKAVHDASLKIGGSIDIPTAIAIAQLALKHRENKTLRQRIIAFVGSPLEGLGADEKAMVKLAKKLKKNNVAIDIVSFGDGIEEGEKSILSSFVESASSGDNSYVSIVLFMMQLIKSPSHIIFVPPGTHLLSDAILSSPILAGDRGIPEEAIGVAGPSSSGTGGPTDVSRFDFGVDPTLDPDLAMVHVLLLSLFVPY